MCSNQYIITTWSAVQLGVLEQQRKSSPIEKLTSKSERHTKFCISIIGFTDKWICCSNVRVWVGAWVKPNSFKIKRENLQMQLDPRGSLLSPSAPDFG